MHPICSCTPQYSTQCRDQWRSVLSPHIHGCPFYPPRCRPWDPSEFQKNRARWSSLFSLPRQVLLWIILDLSHLSYHHLVNRSKFAFFFGSVYQNSRIKIQTTQCISYYLRSIVDLLLSITVVLFMAYRCFKLRCKEGNCFLCTATIIMVERLRAKWGKIAAVRGLYMLRRYYVTLCS